MGEAFITRRGGGGGGTAGLNFEIIGGAYLPKSKSRNLLPYPFYNGTTTVSGVTFTDNGDGTVTADGTCTASNYSVFRCIGTLAMNDPRQRLLSPGTYTLSGCPAGGGESTYKMEVLATVSSTMLGVDTGAGVSFTLTEETLVRVNIVVVAGATVSGLVFKPQLEKGSAATEFVRYKYEQNAIWLETETEIASWDFSADHPALQSNNKNLIVYPYYQTTQTTNGVTFTDNGDGSIKASGTATDYAYFRCGYTTKENHLMYLRKGTYTLSGCPAGGSTNTYALEAYCYTAPDVIHRDIGAGVTFTLDEDTLVRVAILIKTGTTVNATFKPQLEKGTAATDFVNGDATGQVWISTGTSSPAEFNALEKYGIQVYPLSAKQYASGAWVDKTAKSYQGGAWVEWMPEGALYYHGDQIVDVTGGWQFTNFDGWSFDSSYGSMDSGLSIAIPTSGNRGGVFTTKNKVTKGNYTKLCFLLSNYDAINSAFAVRVGVTSQSTSPNITGHFSVISSPTGNGVYKVDISGASSTFYVGCGATNQGQVTFDEVWME